MIMIQTLIKNAIIHVVNVIMEDQLVIIIVLNVLNMKMELINIISFILKKVNVLVMKNMIKGGNMLTIEPRFSKRRFP